MNSIDYTFQLSPGSKTRYNAGSYDQDNQVPRYSLEISIPEHVKHQVEIRQFLMGNEGNRIWIWEIENKSSWPAFILIMKDGALVNGNCTGA